MSGAERIDGLAIERYQALPGERSSGLRDVLVSPLLYRYRRESEQEDRDVLRLGRATHTAILEPHRFRAEYVVWTGGRRAGNEWKAFQVEHQQTTILTEDQHATSLAIAKAVRSDPIAAALLEGEGRAEVTITWRHERTGLALKARPDWLGAALVELKTCRDPAPARFASQVAGLGYHVQVAHYAAALAALGLERRPVKIVAAQNVPPYDVAVYDVPEDVIQVGERRAEEALDRILECTRSGWWPGVGGDAELTLHLPRWALPDFDSDDGWSVAIAKE